MYTEPTSESAPSAPQAEETVPAPPSPLVTVHFLENSRAQRIMFLLEELEVPYAINLFKRTSVGLAPKELFDVHPLGKSPVITDETSGRTIAESGAIVEYLIAKYGNGKAWVPSFSDEDAWVSNQYFTHFSEATLQPRLVHRRVFRETIVNSPAVIRPIVKAVMKKLDSVLVEPELKRCGELIEAHLSKTKKASDGSLWFAGGDLPTSADFMMFFSLELLVSRSPTSVGPISMQWIKDIQARDAYKRGLQKTGPYSFMVQTS